MSHFSAYAAVHSDADSDLQPASAQTSSSETSASASSEDSAPDTTSDAETSSSIADTSDTASPAEAPSSSDTGEISYNSGQYGAAISVNNGSAVTMNGGSIIHNTATGSGRGGALNLDGTTTSFTMNGGIIGDNTAIDGAGIFCYNSITTINNGTFENNTASNQGGGIYNPGGTLTIAPAGAADIVSFVGNHAMGHGGIYNTGSLTFTGGDGAIRFTGNATADSGGGIYTNGSLTIPALSGGVSFANNQSTGADQSGGGGALFVPGNLSITGAAGGVAFSGNTATYRGGGIYAGDGLVITKGSGSIDFAQNASLQSDGGAIYVNAGNTTITGGTEKISFTGNTALGDAGDGGALFIDGGGTVALTDVSITHNQAKNDGGGIRGVGTAVTLRNTDIRYNNGQYCAGISVNGGSGKIDMDSTVTITHNTGAIRGGGINIDNATLAMHGGTISHNEASNSGGGLFASGSALASITGGDIMFNTASFGGGCIRTAPA